MLFMRLPFAWIKRSIRVIDAIHYAPILTLPFPARTLRAPAHIESASSKRREGQTTIAGPDNRFERDELGLAFSTIVTGARAMSTKRYFGTVAKPKRRAKVSATYRKPIVPRWPGRSESSPIASAIEVTKPVCRYSTTLKTSCFERFDAIASRRFAFLFLRQALYIRK
jgi:hypothetical protein